MAIKDILVQIDHSASCKPRFEIAAALAEKYDAHLTGLFVIPSLHIPVYSGIAVPTAMAQVATEYRNELAGTAQNLFNELESCWENRISWITGEGEISTGILEYSGISDILILGQHNKNDSGDVNVGVVERVIMSSGRPVLVTPHTPVDSRSGSAIGKTIMVAWNGRRESIRCVHDSMTLLKDADTVHVSHVGNADHDEIPGVDIAEHLARHGVAVEFEHTNNRGGSEGEILLTLARRCGADMMVMGAYGHSRIRETVLGGVTRHVLREMTIPVMMSH